MPGIRKTENTWRVRQTAPNYERYATKDIGGGVSLVLGISKGKTETQSIVFDKKQFPKKESISAWIKNHPAYHMSEAEDGDDNESVLSEEMFAIKLSEDGTGNWSWNEVLREGTFGNSATGKNITVSVKTIENLIENFCNNVRGLSCEDGSPRVDLDYDHKKDAAKGNKAAGWVGELEMRDHKVTKQEAENTKFKEGQVIQSLWMKPKYLTPEAQEAIKGKEWQFWSVDYNDWQNPENSKIYKDVLFGVSLTNRPSVKWLAPVRLSEGEEEAQKNTAADNGDKTTKGVQTMKKLLALLMGMGVKLSETSTDEVIDHLAADKIVSLTEIAAVTEKKLSEAIKEADTAKKELSEVKTKLASYEEKAKEVKLAEVRKSKEELVTLAEESGKFTPAQLKDPEFKFNKMLSEERFDDARFVLELAGVKLKEKKKLEEEDENEPDGDEIDTKKPWNEQKNSAKDKAAEKKMKDKKLDEGSLSERERSVAYGVAMAEVEKDHAEKYAEFKKSGGKK